MTSGTPAAVRDLHTLITPHERKRPKQPKTCTLPLDKPSIILSREVLRVSTAARLGRSLGDDEHFGVTGHDLTNTRASTAVVNRPRRTDAVWCRLLGLQKY